MTRNSLGHARHYRCKVNYEIKTEQETRSMERASAQSVAFRMPKQVVMY